MPEAVELRSLDARATADVDALAKRHRVQRHVGTAE
jgi:hypothetical protein